MKPVAFNWFSLSSMCTVRSVGLWLSRITTATNSVNSERDTWDRNTPHLNKMVAHFSTNMKVVLRFCFRIPTGTERGTQWAEKAPSQQTMSRKGKESSQEGNSVLCRKYQRGEYVLLHHCHEYSSFFFSESVWTSCWTPAPAQPYFCSLHGSQI